MTALDDRHAELTADLDALPADDPTRPARAKAHQPTTTPPKEPDMDAAKTAPRLTPLDTAILTELRRVPGATLSVEFMGATQKRTVRRLVDFGLAVVQRGKVMAVPQ